MEDYLETIVPLEAKKKAVRVKDLTFLKSVERHATLWRNHELYLSLVVYNLDLEGFGFDQILVHGKSNYAFTIFNPEGRRIRCLEVTELVQQDLDL